MIDKTKHEIGHEYLYGRILRRRIRRLRWTCTCGLRGRWHLPGLGDAVLVRADYDLVHLGMRKAEGADVNEEPMIYTVGWIERWHRIGRAIWHIRRVPRGERLKLHKWAWSGLQYELSYCIRQARKGNWRAIRNTVVGWRAEHPQSLACGSGMTRRAALRSLNRRLAALNEGGDRG